MCVKEREREREGEILANICHLHQNDWRCNQVQLLSPSPMAASSPIPTPAFSLRLAPTPRNSDAADAASPWKPQYIDLRMCSRALMGCSISASKGGKAPHQCPLGNVALLPPLLLSSHADVRSILMILLHSKAHTDTGSCLYLQTPHPHPQT